MKKSASLIALVCLLVSPALFAQAGITGKWIFSGQGPQGPLETAINLKGDGKGGLTGAIEGGGQSLAISEGKITGNDVSFKIIPPPNPQMPPDLKLAISFAGKLDGDSLSLTTSMSGLPEGMQAPPPQTQVGKRAPAEKK